ncbi:MAG: peptide deformylase [candidate division WWE3 bacterium GW2011_GWC1_41_7]|uniref:Peptide deformylase n=3 Tax=Katanobacteria TaxID=422282 RepID=A0A0G1A6C9_UNCKA|nr:MAG: peptide deformylase [candidate division WWE3 bacterium GW2011_GWB1_41_6]KKS20888.1 MAG: peptide deformylase [candidate division WWE3 bacterium GW2011_GWC1_41_7]KKS21869.1 MAG: peptide deformylase [candidate division WWE3 bacterium GW2011_GWA1_41_8]
MSVVPIITIPDKRLLQPCEKVTDFGSGTQKVIRNLKDTLQNAKNPEGAGLAAPQIGVLKRITIVRNYVFNPADKETPIVQEFVLINPKIISQSKDTIVEYEGCLSVPNSYGKVERNKKVKIKAQDESGETIRLTASGFFSAVIQHEIDHLNGVLFTSKTIGGLLTEKEFDQFLDVVAG